MNWHCIPKTTTQTINMYKLAILPLFFAAVSAGYLGAAPIATSYAAPALYGAGYGYAAHAAPLAVAHAAPLAVAHAPVATSYANTYRTVNKAVAVAAPVSYAAPVAAVAHAPVATVAHAAPLAYSAGYGGYGLGYGRGLGYSGLGYSGLGYSGLGYSGLGYSGLYHH